MQIKSQTPLQIPDIRSQPIKELLGPRIRTSEELEQLKMAFEFKAFEFVCPKAEYDASITDESSDEEEEEYDVNEVLQTHIAAYDNVQPNGMIKPQYI